MKNGHCPNCESANIYMARNGFQTIYTMPLGLLKGTMTVELLDYVCADCGLTERHVADPKVLAKIAELAVSGDRWAKV